MSWRDWDEEEDGPKPDNVPCYRYICPGRMHLTQDEEELVCDHCGARILVEEYRDDEDGVTDLQYEESYEDVWGYETLRSPNGKTYLSPCHIDVAIVRRLSDGALVCPKCGEEYDIDDLEEFVI